MKSKADLESITSPLPLKKILSKDNSDFQVTPVLYNSLDKDNDISKESAESYIKRLQESEARRIVKNHV